MKKILFCFVLMLSDAQAVTLQCTNSPMINVPAGTRAFVQSEISDSFMLNNTVSIVVESVNGSTVKNIPVSLWHAPLTNIWFVAEDGSEISVRDYQINADTLELRVPDDGLKYKVGHAWVSLSNMSSVSANNPRIVLRNKMTGQIVASANVNYTIVSPATAALWVLPAQKDIGEMHPGETMNLTLAGPGGAPGRVRGLSMIGDRELITVNGCGVGCSADIADGGLMKVMANAEKGMPEGEYGLNVEATLLCD